MYKVTKIKPSEVLENWEKFIKPAIEVSLPPTDIGLRDMKVILNAMMKDYLHCWLLYEAKGDMKPLAIATTKFSGNPGVEAKNLLIYSLFSVGGLKEEALKLGFNTLKKFAKVNDCQKIIGYTNISRIVDMVKSLPEGKAEFILVSMEVDNE